MNEEQHPFLVMLKDLDDNNQRFFYSLVGMAHWALAHPSTSRFEYVSPDRVKAHKHLNATFMNWCYEEHPNMSDSQRELFEDSVSRGLCPAAVVEHTPDGHHPIGWSWGSEWYIADFYLSLTRAIIQYGEQVGNDLNDEFASIYIAIEVFGLNRVDPTPEIVAAMGERLEETERTRSFSVFSGVVN